MAISRSLVPAALHLHSGAFVQLLLFPPSIFSLSPGDKDGSKVTTVVATPGQGPDRPQEVSYTDTKVIGNGSFGVVYQAKLCDSGELVAIKKVLQDKRFKVSRTSALLSPAEPRQGNRLLCREPSDPCLVALRTRRLRMRG